MISTFCIIYSKLGISLPIKIMQSPILMFFSLHNEINGNLLSRYASLNNLLILFLCTANLIFFLGQPNKTFTWAASLCSKIVQLARTGNFMVLFPEAKTALIWISFFSFSIFGSVYFTLQNNKKGRHQPTFKYI